MSDRPENAPTPFAGPMALELTGLAKSFDRPVIQDLDLRGRPGELYALLGPNGAGKTTTLRLALGLTPPDKGRISIFGVDALANPGRAKAITGWLPDEPMLYDKLTPLEYLAFVAGLWAVPPAAGAAGAGRPPGWLGPWGGRPARRAGVSPGLKQKGARARGPRPTPPPP